MILDVQIVQVEQIPMDFCNRQLAPQHNRVNPDIIHQMEQPKQDANNAQTEQTLTDNQTNNHAHQLNHVQ
jgi:hypothetical protein